MYPLRKGRDMSCRRRCGQEGLTLLELTVALALFAIVLGATAQGLISYHVAMDMQAQRCTAAQNCRSFLSDMRRTRDANPDAYPETILEEYPEGTEFPGTLPGERLTVEYEDPSANPLEVTVRSRSIDLRNHEVTVSLSTNLTDS